MPVTKSFLPERHLELADKLRSNEPGQEAQLLKDIIEHVGEGHACYIQTPKGARVVDLKADKCFVFLIKGRFKCCGKDDYREREAHVVEQESTIVLEEGTAIVIINQV